MQMLVGTSIVEQWDHVIFQWTALENTLKKDFNWQSNKIEIICDFL